MVYPYVTYDCTSATTGADIVSINKPCRESSTEVAQYLGNVGSKQYFIANSGKLVSDVCFHLIFA